MRGPGNTQAAAHPGQPPGALLGAELFIPTAMAALVVGVREELAEKFPVDVVAELRSIRSLTSSACPTA
jgi:hypothetical protein